MALCGCVKSCDSSDADPRRHNEDCSATPTLRDADNSQLVLRGINVSADSKWSTHHLPSYGFGDLQHLRQAYGFNAIRLLVFWQAIEPYPGWYNRDYLDAIKAYVGTAHRAGLRVVIDMHQDVYGAGFAQAGAPRWSCDEDLYASFQPPDDWFMGYVQPEVGLCFDRLYQEPQTRAAFAAAWARLAQHLADHPGVFAFDLINEPFWGSSSAATFEKDLAPPFYREIIDAVRDVHPDVRVGIEPTITTNVGVNTALGALHRGRLLYMPHVYPREVEIDRRYLGDTAALRQHVVNLCEDAQRLQSPLLIGELGVRGDAAGAQDYLRDLYDVFDSEHLSAFYWHLGRDGSSGYGIWERDGGPSLQGRAVARPYVERCSGNLLDWAWYDDDHVFVAEWLENDASTAPTVIATPTLALPVGFRVDLDPEGKFELRPGQLRIEPTGGRRRVVLTATSVP